MKKGTKAKIRRNLAVVLALVVVGLSQPQVTDAASADDRWPLTASVENVLTYYQYFVKGDTSLGGSAHTVGPVIVGGSLVADNTIGDGAQIGSYANHIVKAIKGGAQHDYGGTNTDFYYKTAATTLNEYVFTQNDNYIDVTAAFNSIISESVGMSSSAAVPSVNDDGSVLTCDLNGSVKNYVITYEQFLKAKTINLLIDDVNTIRDNKCVINIVGVENSDIKLDGEAWGGYENGYATNVFFNGNSNIDFLEAIEGAAKPGECNLSGMKLIFNFPDATGEIQWNGMSAHVVAPKAYVDITSGQFNGGVIANTVTSIGQGHYYSYNNPNSNINQIIANSLEVQKTYLDVSGNAADTPGVQAKFTLYYDEACTKPVSGCQDIEATVVNGKNMIVVAGSSLSLGTDYYLRESVAPTGYATNNTIYCCRVANDGSIQYKELGKNPETFTSASPICVNVQAATPQAAKGSLVISVEDKDSRDKVAGAVIQIQGSAYNQSFTSTTTGPIQVNDLPSGDYTLTMTTIPSEYKVSQTTINVSVAENQVTYAGYQLWKTGTLEISVKEEGTGISIQGTKVEVVDISGKKHTATSNASGEVILNDLPVGNAQITITEVPEGYLKPSTTQIQTVVPTSTAVPVTLKKTELGTVTVTVTDNTNAPVEKVKVMLTAPDGTIYSVETNASGEAAAPKLPVGNYTAKVISLPAGYTVESGDNASAQLDANDTINFPIKLYASGGLVVKVVEEGTDRVIPGASVTITNSKGVDTTTTTNSNGEIVLINQPVGDCTVTVNSVPDGYKMPATATSQATIQKGVTTNHKVEIDVPRGNISITVREDGSTGTAGLIKGAKVELLDASRNLLGTVETDANGNYVISNQKVGTYITKITSVPAGYKMPTTTEQTVMVTEGATAVSEFRPTVTGGVVPGTPDSGNQTNPADPSNPGGSGEGASTVMPEDHTDSDDDDDDDAAIINTNHSASDAAVTKTTAVTSAGVVKAPKTGDITYIPYAVVVLVIAMGGLIVTLTYRKIDKEY